jgi:hypothetical protein
MLRSSATKSGKESPVELWEELSSELWQVKDGLGLPKTMTLDALDAAFKRDEITTHTLVRKVGTLKWQTLAEVAGIEPSSPTLESESLMPVTSEIDVTAPKIPRPPAMPRIALGQSTADDSQSYEALHSEDLLPDVNDTLRVTRVAGVGDTFDDDEVTTRFTRPTAAPRHSTARKIFGMRVAAVAVVGLGVFGGVSFLLSREFGRTRTGAASAAAMVVTPPAVSPPPATEPSPAPLTISAIEGSLLVINPAAALEVEPAAATPPAASASVRAAAVVGRRPPMVQKKIAAPAPPRAAHASGHFAVKAEPKKGFGANANAQHSFKAKTH